MNNIDTLRNATLAARLRSARRATGWTQEQLAAKAGATQAVV